MDKYELSKNKNEMVDLQKLRHDIMNSLNAINSAFDVVVKNPNLKNDCISLFSDSRMRLNKIMEAMEKEEISPKNGDKYNRS